MSTNARRPVACWGGDDAAGVLERVGQRQLDEHVVACLHGPHGDLGVQPGGQADVD
jgi:hypothetical protein